MTVKLKLIVSLSAGMHKRGLELKGSLSWVMEDRISETEIDNPYSSLKIVYHVHFKYRFWPAK